MADEPEKPLLSILDGIRQEQHALRRTLNALADSMRRVETRNDRRTQALERRLLELRDELERMRDSELRSARRRAESAYAQRLRARADTAAPSAAGRA